MGQAQQKRRALLIVEDDAELRSLTAALFEDEQMDKTPLKGQKLKRFVKQREPLRTTAYGPPRGKMRSSCN
jgi:hypothetical protein